MVLFALLLTALVSSSLVLADQQPLLDVKDDFGVGFDFTPSYGLAAVSYANGSNIPLARINGSEDWSRMIFEISRDSGWWPPPIPSWCLPVLTDMVKSLAKAAGERLGGGKPIEAAAVVLAPTNRQTRYKYPVYDLLKEAFAAAGVKFLDTSLQSWTGEPLLYIDNGQIAGHGLGLCYPYNRNRSCVSDGSQPQLTKEAYFLVGFYENEMEFVNTQLTVYAGATIPGFFIDYSLGARARHQNPDEKYYWEAVRQFMLRGATRTYTPPTRIILYGEYSSDEKFRRLLKEVVDASWPDIPPPRWIEDGVDPVFAGAFGAAEFAKRLPYFPKIPKSSQTLGAEESSSHQKSGL